MLRSRDLTSAHVKVKIPATLEELKHQYENAFEKLTERQHALYVYVQDDFWSKTMYWNLNTGDKITFSCAEDMQPPYMRNLYPSDEISSITIGKVYLLYPSTGKSYIAHWLALAGPDGHITGADWYVT